MLVIIAAFVYILARNMVASLRKQGIALGFNFLNDAAGFDIGEMLIPYTSTDTFARALQVGILNTLVVCVIGVVLSTLLGILVGLARLSDNFLVNRLARAFVEAMRNVLLLVLLIFIRTEERIERGPAQGFGNLPAGRLPKPCWFLGAPSTARR